MRFRRRYRSSRFRIRRRGRAGRRRSPRRYMAIGYRM